MAIQTIEVSIEHIRKRPFMWISSKVDEVLRSLLVDCIELCKTDAILCSITLEADSSFTLEVSSNESLEPFFSQFSALTVSKLIYNPQVVKVLSKRFEVTTSSSNSGAVNFLLDDTIFHSIDIDYYNFFDSMLELTMLNPRLKVVTIDKRQKQLNQNYFHFSQGVFYLFNRLIAEALGKPKLRLEFDGYIGKNKYQIGIAYRTDWFPKPQIVSFANDIRTIGHGSLVNGAIDGILLACKQYVHEKGLKDFKVKKSKLLNGLILACTVRGNGLKYGGSFKEYLDDELVQQQAKEAISSLLFSHLSKSESIIDDFLWRFNENHLTSIMY